MRALLALLTLVFFGMSCGGDPECCWWRVVAAPTVRYVAAIPNPDGGMPTQVEFVLDAQPTSDTATEARLTFKRDGREIVERFTATQRQP